MNANHNTAMHAYPIFKVYENNLEQEPIYKNVYENRSVVLDVYCS